MSFVIYMKLQLRGKSISSFYKRVGSVGLGIKIVGLSIGIVIFFGLVVSLVVSARFSDQLSRDLNAHALSIAQSFVSHCEQARCQVYVREAAQIAAVAIQSDPQAAYIIVLDNEGGLIARQARPEVPSPLLEPAPPKPDELHRVINRVSQNASFRQVTERLADTSGFIIVGVSETPSQVALAEMVDHLIIATLIAMLVSVLMAMYLTQVLVRPIHRLIDAVRSISLEHLTSHTEPTLGDEIGELTHAINAMTADLARSRDALMDQNRELATLNAIAQTTSASLDLSHILHTTLDAVLRQLDLSAGWILLAEFGHEFPLTLAARVGIGETFAREEMTRERKGCICVDVLGSGTFRVVRDMQKECCCLDPNVIAAEGLITHSCIPLVSSDQVVGIMNVAAKTPRTFTTAEINLMCSIGRQVGMAVDNALLWEAVKRSEVLRGRLLERVFKTQEDERRRIALELHDQIGSSLASLGVGLRRLEEGGAGSGAATQSEAASGLNSKFNGQQTQIAELEAQVDEIAQEMHKIALDLRPTVLDQFGLVEAVGQIAKSFSRQNNLPVEFHAIRLDGLRMSPQIETGLFRIVQEALTNVARHAHATEINIMLERREANVVLMIEDNGRGFEAPATAAAGERLGLFGMQERAAQLGGRLTIESAPGHGMTIYVEVPVVENDV